MRINLLSRLASDFQAFHRRGDDACLAFIREIGNYTSLLASSNRGRIGWSRDIGLATVCVVRNSMVLVSVHNLGVAEGSLTIVTSTLIGSYSRHLTSSLSNSVLIEAALVRSSVELGVCELVIDAPSLSDCSTSYWALVTDDMQEAEESWTKDYTSDMHHGQSCLGIAAQQDIERLLGIHPSQFCVNL